MTSPAALARDIGFDLPKRYNCARLLWDNLPDRAERIAVYHDDGAWTYAALAEEAARIGNALLDAGSTPGDRILMLLEDHPAYPAALMGAMRAGLVPVLLNTLSTPEQIAYFLRDSAASAVIVSQAFSPLVDAAARDGTPCRTALIAETRPWAEASPALPEHPTTRRDMAFWMYSSGSTGKPKGVVHKHEDAAYTAVTYAREILKIGPDDICFSIPKIFFAYGFGNAITFPFSVGAASVLLSDRPTPPRCFQQIARHRPTILFGLPTLYTALVNDPGIETADLSSLRLCISAAEVLSNELAETWRARFGLPIVEGLGSTEMLHIYLSNDAAAQRPGSAGRVVPGYALRLITPDGTEAGDGEEGVMQVMGLSGAEYYWNRPDKTAETMRDGWLDTGDRFVRDADGFHFFRGRADDLVKVSGQWVYPMEIEWALNDHPQVREACVLAMTLRDGRATIKAWVTPRDPAGGTDALRAELVRHAKTVLLPHKYPREIAFLDPLPKTGTDKIDRQALRALDATKGDVR
ncbi:benzoate-CoA ligase family protein [Sulfitobacter sp. D35]|uniref:benzoate-CoA ligase family protein n=1 Tax=Sulfitobacter sp. D35 TaxID=3083252 RepID=UPI00296F0FD0|nr:benzoate-CoA ligase family protein [Sulfitobacter sp. D35]MDW4499245.1 benzoate-CoA ligase family protein [Sulfitobacter sp. D35]